MGGRGPASVCIVCGGPREGPRACVGEECAAFLSASCPPLSLGLASSPLYYITALTALYESVAIIVDQHQPVVEKYYGPGKMTSVLKRLLQEADRVTKDLVEGWEEERSMKRKVRPRTSFQGILTNRI